MVVLAFLLRTALIIYLGVDLVIIYSRVRQKTMLPVGQSIIQVETLLSVMLVQQAENYNTIVEVLVFAVTLVLKQLSKYTNVLLI